MRLAFVIPLCAALSLAAAVPALADTADDALNAAFDGAPLAAASLDELRGGASFFDAFSSGTTAKVQFGDTNVSQHHDASPSTSTATLTSGGNFGTATATLGVGGASAFTTSRQLTLSTASNTTHGFTIGF